MDQGTHLLGCSTSMGVEVRASNLKKKSNFERKAMREPRHTEPGGDSTPESIDDSIIIVPIFIPIHRVSPRPLLFLL